MDSYSTVCSCILTAAVWEGKQHPNGCTYLLLKHKNVRKRPDTHTFRVSLSLIVYACAFQQCRDCSSWCCCCCCALTFILYIMAVMCVGVCESIDHSLNECWDSNRGTHESGCPCALVSSSICRRRLQERHSRKNIVLGWEPTALFCYRVSTLS